jgi:hypothetical protein
VITVWATDSRWFDVAAVTTLWLVLVVIFGHFEQHRGPWRRLFKIALVLTVLLVLIEAAGRAWAYGALALLLALGGSVHFVLLTKAGINPWTGEPRARFHALLDEGRDQGEWRTFMRVMRGDPARKAP